MWFKQIRVFMVMMAQLAFFSQAFAAVDLPCKAMDHHMMSAMEHSSHLQSHLSNIDDIPPCCDHEQCAQKHCATMSSAGLAAVGAYAPFSSQPTGTLITEYSVSYRSTDSSSLFRPPNSR